MAKKKESMEAKRERLLKRMGKHKSSYNRNYFHLEDGAKAVIRILPEVGDMEDFYQQVGRHHITDDQKLLCIDFTQDGAEPCPVCELSKSLYEAKDKEGGRKYLVRRSFHMNVVVQETNEEGTKVWSEPMRWTPGVTVFEQIFGIISEEDYGVIADAYTGNALLAKREGTGLETTYQILPRAKKVPLAGSVEKPDDEEIERILNAADDLSDILNHLPSAEDLRNEIGLDALDDDEDDIDEDDFEGFE